jgi:hypothetical protein
MQITWMEFKDNWNVDVNVHRVERGTQFYGVIEYFHNWNKGRPAWIAWHEFYA